MLQTSKTAVSGGMGRITGDEQSVGTVLVVDSEGPHRDMVVAALRLEGFDIHTVECGPTALHAARDLQPDLIVLDICRPGVDGSTLCRDLKAQSPTLLPILHLSAAATSSQDRVLGLKAGADSYLAHPLDANELGAAVAALIRLKRQEIGRLAEAAVNSLLTDALDTLADNVALLGPTGDVIAINRAWVNFAEANGYCDGGTGLGVNYCDLCEGAVGSGRAEANAAAIGIRQVLGGTEECFEVDYPCHSPTEERWFRMTARRVSRPGPVVAVVTHSDRTRETLARRTETSALAEAETDRQRLAATLEALPVGVWLADSAGRLTHTNPAAAELWGGEAPHSDNPDEYGVYRAWWPETGKRIAPPEWALARSLATGERVTGELVEIERFDGKRSFLLNSTAAILDREGQISGGVVVMVDVTERQSAIRERERLVESLERTEQRLREQFDKLPVPTYLYEERDDSFALLEMNEAAIRAFPWHDRSLIGRLHRDCLLYTSPSPRDS